jgi:hypothetical protein
MRPTDTLPSICFDCRTVFHGTHDCGSRPPAEWTDSSKTYRRSRAAELKALRVLIDHVIHELES